MKLATCAALGLADANQLLLFHHKREMSQSYDGRTLAEMGMHTGFSVRGFDLTEPPDFWPAVRAGPDGLEIV